MNNLTIAGYLPRDAEVRFAKSGTAITTFTLPVESGWGENKKTTWVKCVLFGKKGGGEHGLTPFLKKGQYLVVTGELTLEEWENTEGKHSQVSCVVRESSLGGVSKGFAEDAVAPTHGQGSTGGAQRPTGRQPDAPTNDFDDFDSSIPF